MFILNFSKWSCHPSHWKLILISLLTLMLTWLPLPISAQSPTLNSLDKSPIIVDGIVLFQVGSLNNFSAQQRADIINKTLAEEVLSPEPVELIIFQDLQQTVIRNYTTKRHLLSVTEVDVIEGINSFEQAVIWKKHLSQALERGQFERSSAYLSQAILSSLGIILAVIIIQAFLIFLGVWAEKKWFREWNQITSNFYVSKEFIKLLWRIFLLVSPILIWLSGILYICYLFPQSRSRFYQVKMLLWQPIFTLGDKSYSALQLLLLLALTVGLWFLVKGLVFLIKSYLLSRLGANRTVQEIVGTFTQYIFLFLGLIILLQLWGLDLSALAIIASVLGVGIGFGIQNIANNFISGLIIILERPIQVGDFIKLGDLVGTVQNVGSRSTQIKTWDGVSIIVPNSRFLESEVINWSHGDSTSAIRLPIGVAYGSDIKRVRVALLKAAREHQEILANPRPKVLFQEFGDSSLNFELRVWLKEPRHQFRIKSDLNYAIEKNLRDYGIEIPFPQRDLNLRSPHLQQLIKGLFPTKEIITSDSSKSAKFVDEYLASSLSEKELDPLEERLTDSELKALVKQMRSPNGLSLEDRRYRLNIYPDCFIGSEAVNWLVEHQNYTREEAIEFGQILIERGIIHHVLDQHSFEDSYLFYRFCDNEKL
ncbi:mechanosensitive ion channel domain-containing protein [Crocosphaera sp. XPORK-15E]|uniref:mechanosensitive ion channel domain-containing protein n=1 Tax=Crocosphaera sp. XPORK-15E TaxID=3110247 RepID=UPI002B1FB8CB|nr:mechanosensitive ion channel domain-containing protein [Crocosphaera sp. XPORK-15E]MEA5532614.1 mechanosensitive ion channel domain-containing protein [Crocosphaera sp. XPORK-15E]